MLKAKELHKVKKIFFLKIPVFLPNLILKSKMLMLLLAEN